MEFKNIDFNYIYNYCIANNEKEWLKAEMVKQVPCKVYPKVKKDGKMFK